MTQILTVVISMELEQTLAAEMLALLLCIRDVPGSDLSPEAGYFD
jgi:hypothetical protein